LRLIILFFWLAVISSQAFSAVTVTVNGSNHTIPQTNEKGWGTNVTAWIQAISQYTLQPNGGTFNLTAEVNTGSTYGFKVPYIKTATSTPSTAGVLRLARTDSVGWRNQADSGNLLLSVDSSNNLEFNGVDILTSATGNFADDTFYIYDNGDNSKKIAFQASGITGSTTRTITMPDADVDLTDVSTATSSNTNSAIVKRDGSGNFSATTITAALSGNASTATALAANPSDCGSNTFAQSIVASGALTCAGVSLSTADTTGVLTVAKGGTGLTLGTSGGVLVSVGTTSFGLTGIGTTTTVLKGGAAPAFSQVSLTTDVSGILPVANGGTNGVKTVSAMFSSGTTTSQEYGGDWVNGNPSNNSTGDNSIGLTSSFFSAAPNCTCTVVNDSNPNSRYCKIRTSSTSTIRVFTANTSDAAAAETFMIVCQGPG